MEVVDEKKFSFFNPITYLFQFLASYGWYLVGLTVLLIYVAKKLQPTYEKWRQAREDAEYHKDPDKVVARMEAIQRAREKQQKLLLEASEKALEVQKEKEEKKRQENAERLKKYGESAGGQRVGSGEDYLPLSGGPSSSSYRPPKRSACSGGGCGR